MVETAMSGGGGSGGGGGMCGSAVQVLRGRWFMMFASFLIMAGAGATYLYGIYSKVVKSTLGYDQTTINLIGFFKDLGANVGVLSGLIAEVTPPWFVLLIGSAMNFVGYFMIWLAITGKIAKPAVWQMCLYICIGANSQNFANTGALVTCVKNFPESRGIMLGLLKGFVGLSGAIMAQLYLAIYGTDSKSLILLIGWLPAVVSIIFVYTIRTMKVSRHPNEVKVLYEYLYVALAMALLLMALNIAQKFVSFSHVEYSVGAAVVILLLFIPVAIAIREEYISWSLKKQPISPPNQITVENPNPIKESNPVQSPQSSPIPLAEKPKVSGFAQIFKKPDRGEDYTILQALLSVDMLILFLATFCGYGCSLTAIDNLGQIGESLGYPTRTVSTFVSLVSIWNFLGRVTAGFSSEVLLLKWGFPRTLMMTFALLLSCIGLLLIAFPVSGSIYVASVFIGFAFGAQLTLLFAIISELFGLKYYSTLFNCGQLASPLGSYVLNVKVTGFLYDREALKQLAQKGMDRSSVKELICIGFQCYKLSFIVLAGVSLFGAIASLVLVIRTREFYRGDIYKKFREEAEAAEKQLDGSHN